MTDADGNLRLTLKRRGADGQVRLERTEKSVRFTMPLGRWKKLEPDGRRAMIALASQANAGTRLARVVWLEDTDGCRCEVACDLTGLPCEGSICESFFGIMVRMAVTGLELSLRRLALELGALARPQGRELVKQLLWRRRNERPG